MKAAHLNSSLNFFICYLQDDKAAEGVSNVTPTRVNPANTTANVIGGTGNKTADSSGIDNFDDAANDKLLAAAARAEAPKGPVEPSLGVPGGPNLYQKLKERSVTGAKKNEVCTNLS